MDVEYISTNSSTDPEQLRANPNTPIVRIGSTILSLQQELLNSIEPQANCEPNKNNLWKYQVIYKNIMPYFALKVRGPVTVNHHFKRKWRMALYGQHKPMKELKKCLNAFATDLMTRRGVISFFFTPQMEIEDIENIVLSKAIKPKFDSMEKFSDTISDLKGTIYIFFLNWKDIKIVQAHAEFIHTELFPHNLFEFIALFTVNMPPFPFRDQISIMYIWPTYEKEKEWYETIEKTILQPQINVPQTNVSQPQIDVPQTNVLQLLQPQIDVSQPQIDVSQTNVLQPQTDKHYIENHYATIIWGDTNSIKKVNQFIGHFLVDMLRLLKYQYLYIIDAIRIESNQLLLQYAEVIENDENNEIMGAKILFISNLHYMQNLNRTNNLIAVFLKQLIDNQILRIIVTCDDTITTQQLDYLFLYKPLQNMPELNQKPKIIKIPKQQQIQPLITSQIEQKQQEKPPSILSEIEEEHEDEEKSSIPHDAPVENKPIETEPSMSSPRLSAKKEISEKEERQEQIRPREGQQVIITDNTKIATTIDETTNNTIKWLYGLLILSSFINLLFTALFATNLYTHQIVANDTNYNKKIQINSMFLILFMIISIFLCIFLIIMVNIDMIQRICVFNVVINFICVLFYINFYYNFIKKIAIYIQYVNIFYGAFNLLIFIPINARQLFLSQ